MWRHNTMATSLTVEFLGVFARWFTGKLYTDEQIKRITSGVLKLPEAI